MQISKPKYYFQIPNFECLNVRSSPRESGIVGNFLLKTYSGCRSVAKATEKSKEGKKKQKEAADLELSELETRVVSVTFTTWASRKLLFVFHHRDFLPIGNSEFERLIAEHN